MELKLITENELTIFEPIDKNKVKTQIYEIRGMRVMLDKDIATYFGVDTGAMNRAMKRNIKRFPQEFCFQITRDEYHEILRCQTGILELEQGKYSKYLPYVYTEHGVSMLTSVLHTDRAIEAGIIIVKVFVEVAHYIRQNTPLIPYEELKLLQHKQEQLSERVQNVEENMVSKDELSDFMKLFDTGIDSDEILILDGEPFKADLAYQKIYEKEESMIINIIVPIEESTKTLKYFEEFNLGEDIQFNISNTGDFECIFRGISPMIDKLGYSSFSITVQEKNPKSDQLKIESN